MMLISPVLEFLFLVTSGFLVFYYCLNKNKSRLMERWYIFVPAMIAGTVFSLILSFTVTVLIAAAVMAAPFLGLIALISKIVCLIKGKEEKPNHYPKFLK